MFRANSKFVTEMRAARHLVKLATQSPNSYFTGASIGCPTSPRSPKWPTNQRTYPRPRRGARITHPSTKQPPCHRPPPVPKVPKCVRAHNAALLAHLIAQTPISQALRLDAHPAQAARLEQLIRYWQNRSPPLPKTPSRAG